MSLSRILRVAFLIALTVSAVVFNVRKPRVMILHSYHPDYAWTRDVNEGIRRVAKNWSGYSVSWHYMSTQQLADQDALRYAGVVARRAIDRVDPQVLIAVDDLAQQLAARFYVDRPDMEIVFAGVNGGGQSYGYDGATNVTGIFERRPLQAVKELILALEQGKEKPNLSPVLLYLMDSSPSMQRDRGFVESFDWSPVRLQATVVASTYEEWQERVLALSEQSVDYLLIANYRALPRSVDDQRFPPPNEIMTWTEGGSAVPVIGANVFNVEDGGAIAVGTSPFEQGEIAARMAERLVSEGRRGGEMPSVVSHQYVVAINQRAVVGRGLRLPQVYETFARSTATFIEDVP